MLFAERAKSINRQDPSNTSNHIDYESQRTIKLFKPPAISGTECFSIAVLSTAMEKPFTSVTSASRAKPRRHAGQAPLMRDRRAVIFNSSHRPTKQSLDHPVRREDLMKVIKEADESKTKLCIVKYH